MSNKYINSEGLTTVLQYLKQYIDTQDLTYLNSKSSEIYLKRNGTNTITGDIRPDQAGTHIFGNSDYPFKGIYTSYILSGSYPLNLSAGNYNAIHINPSNGRVSVKEGLTGKNVPGNFDYTFTVDGTLKAGDTFIENLSAKTTTVSSLTSGDNSNNISLNGSEILIYGQNDSTNTDDAADETKQQLKYGANAPKITFRGNNGQNLSLMYSEYDGWSDGKQGTSLHLATDDGTDNNAWFIAPTIKATRKFIGDLTGNVTGNLAGTADWASKGHWIGVANDRHYAVALSEDSNFYYDSSLKFFYNPATHTLTVPNITGKITNAAYADNATNSGNADTVDGYHETAFPRLVGIKDNTWNWNDVIRAGYYKIQAGTITNHPSGIYQFGMAEVITTENHNDGENRELQIYYPHRQTNNIAIWLRMHNSSTQGNGWGSWVGVPNTNGNIASATKLQTSRTIWGQSFDGTNNIDNTLRIRQTTSDYCEGIRIQTGDNTWATIILGAIGETGTNTNAWSIHRKDDNNFAISRNSADGTNGLVMTQTGMGLGTTAPAYRLDVRGDIYTSSVFRGPYARLSNQNGSIVIGDSTNARISAIGDQLIFNTGNAIRFGDTAWDWNKWAGLKYVHDSKTIYLGIADGSIFNANQAQSGGTLNLVGIDNLTGVGNIQFKADNTYCIGTTTSEAAHTYTRQIWARHLNASRVYNGDTNLYIGYNNTAQVKFYSGTKQSGDGSNERMTISTNGNVGIGTASPTYKLDVNGTGSFTSGIVSNAIISVCSNIEGAQPNQAALEIRERDRGMTNITHDYSNAPRIGFHWRNRYWGNLAFYNGEFQFLNEICNGYCNIVANSFRKIGGSSSQFLKADGSIDNTNYLPLSGGTMSGTLSFFPTGATDAAPKIYSTVSDSLTSLNFEVSDDDQDRFVFKINYYNDTNTTNRERFIIDWNNVISKAPITAPSFNGNATSATKLQTPRTIWGQSFDGTADITGVMTINPPNISNGSDNTLMFKVYSSTGYKNGLAISSTDNVTRLYAKPFGSGAKNALEIHTYNNTDVNAVTIDATGNVGIGTASPTYKLDVVGDIYTTTGFKKNGSNDFYVLLGGGGHKLESSLNVASASVASKVYGQVADTGSHELVRCDMNNDQFRIIAGSNGNNNGWAEIATADDGNEPIYVRQYTGVFSSVKRTLTLLDANGYTHFPSYINIGGNENNNSSPDRVWGSNGSDSYLRSYRTSALNVNYASSAGNADTVDGYHAGCGNNTPYGRIPIIGLDGVMEVGKYIDFHNDNSGKYDFSTRLQTTGNYVNIVNLPSGSGTLALVGDLTWDNIAGKPSALLNVNTSYSKQYVLGVSGTGTQTAAYINTNFYFTSEGPFYTSDINCKHDFTIINNNDIDTFFAHDYFKQFKWNSNNKSSWGVIAQDIESWIPEAVNTDENGKKAVNYDVVEAKAIAALTAKVKQQQEEINKLKQLINDKLY